VFARQAIYGLSDLIIGCSFFQVFSFGSHADCDTERLVNIPHKPGGTARRVRIQPPRTPVRSGKAAKEISVIRPGIQTRFFVLRLENFDPARFLTCPPKTTYETVSSNNHLPGPPRAIDFRSKVFYLHFQREGRIQSAERAVPTFSSTIRRIFFPA
jgi:hypothetical protein